MILCHAAPRHGGKTSFLDMERAWTELPEGALKDQAVAVSVLRDGFSDVKPRAAQNVTPMVRRHPRTGRRSLHVSHPDLMRNFYELGARSEQHGKKGKVNSQGWRKKDFGPTSHIFPFKLLLGQLEHSR
jgi:alpha-ketoglutarate-dependent taurine dioxygenase